MGDADNIDRFDTIRLIGLLNHNKFDSISYEEQVTFVEKQITRFTKLSKMDFSTPTGTKLFQEKIQFSLEFLFRLQAQLKNSKSMN